MQFKFDNTNNDRILARMLDMADSIDDAVGTYGCDLHSQLFNEDYAFTHTSDAEEACESVGTWSAIQLVAQYEKDYFDNVHTEIDPCAVANMCVYIYGEFFLNQSEHLQKAWDRELTKRDIHKIKKELQTFLDEGVSFSGFDRMVWDCYGSY